MNPLVLVQATFFIGYIIHVINKVGIQKSISYSWYVIPNKGMFHAFAAGVGFPMLLYSKYIRDEFTVLLFALAGFFMWFLSVSIVVKQAKYVLIIHYICTFAVIGLTFWGIIRHFNDYSTLITAAIGTIAIALFGKNKLWWIEIWIFFVIIFKLIQL